MRRTLVTAIAFLTSGLIVSLACASSESDATRTRAGGADSAESGAVSTGDSAAGSILGNVMKALGSGRAGDDGSAECVKRSAAARSPEPTATAAGDGRIPVVPGLRIVTAAHRLSDRRDLEVFKDVLAADSDAVTVVSTLGAPSTTEGPTAQNTYVRRILRSDLLTARCHAENYAGDQSLSGPGMTWLSVSRAILLEIRATGESEIGLSNEADRSGRGPITLWGTLRRVGPGSRPFTLVLDDSIAHLPVFLVRGTFRHRDTEVPVELEILDDIDNPMVVSSCCIRSKDRLVRIQRPHAAGQIEKALSETRETVVYGITFEFASATIQPESERVLSEIADVMRRHTDWRLSIQGHTDSIGTAQSNADLSSQRAEAVKAWLVGQLGADAESRLTSAGLGESAPKSDNGTLEGRAANRRVELIRQ